MMKLKSVFVLLFALLLLVQVKGDEEESYESLGRGNYYEPPYPRRFKRGYYRAPVGAALPAIAAPLGRGLDAFGNPIVAPFLGGAGVAGVAAGAALPYGEYPYAGPYGYDERGYGGYDNYGYGY